MSPDISMHHVTNQYLGFENGNTNVEGGPEMEGRSSMCVRPLFSTSSRRESGLSGPLKAGAFVEAEEDPEK